MKIIVKQDYAAACEAVAEIIAQTVRDHPQAKLGLATGSTPIGVYDRLIGMCRDGLDFSAIRTVNLDEYCGVSPDNPVSYRYFMDSQLLDHINIDKANTYVPGSGGSAEELAKFEEKIYENGGIDLQLLGIGNNGHVGFNESADRLRCKAHTEQLTDDTIAANARFFEDKSQVPKTAVTMGMHNIFSAKRIVLLASGAKKADAIRALVMEDYITTRVPATLLKLHADTTVVIDQELADAVGYLR